MLGPTSLLSIAWSFIVWVNPVSDIFLDAQSQPQLRYVMLTSGTDQSLLRPIRFETKTAMGPKQENQEMQSLSVMGMLVANPSSKRHTQPVQISINGLIVPITELKVEPHTIPEWSLEDCSSTDTDKKKFKAEKYTGRNGFCLKVHPFPAGAMVSVFILSGKPTEYIGFRDKIYVQTKDGSITGTPVDLNQLLTVPGLFSPDIFKAVILLNIIILSAGSAVVVYCSRRASRKGRQSD